MSKRKHQLLAGIRQIPLVGKSVAFDVNMQTLCFNQAAVHTSSRKFENRNNPGILG
jgi:hypothetical protein